MFLPSPVIRLFVVEDTECYTYRNTQDFCTSLLNVMLAPLAVLVMPSGSLEHVTALDVDEFQIKNVSTAVVSSVEQWQMTICLSVMSIVASSQYQIVFFWHTENYANEMTGPPAEMTVTQFQSVDLKVTVAPSLLHVGALSFPASFTANFATPETKYRHAFPFPLPSIMTSATARC